MPRTEIRDLARADLPRVLALEPVLFGPEAWTRGMYLDELSHPSRAYRALLLDGVLVGWGGLLCDQDVAQILTLGVGPGHRRLGFGAALLADLMGIARARGAAEVFLEVRASDDGAQRLYARAGFQPIGLRRGYYARAGEDAVVMRAALGAA